MTTQKIMCLRLFIPFLLGCTLLNGQQQFTRKDSLRGALRMERNYNVLYYELFLKPDISQQSLEGTLVMEFIPNEALSHIQLDLVENMDILKIQEGSHSLEYRRDFDAVFIQGDFTKGKKEKISVHYKGKPIKAKNAPWDGGFIWQKDSRGNPWVSVACEGAGASLWWPNKDHLSDEPDLGMKVHITAPEQLMAISNGKLVKTSVEQKGMKTWTWEVSYPINNYNVSLYIGDFIHFTDRYKAKDGALLELNYYVIKGNEEKAKIHFEQVHKMLESYEHYLGKFPFWKDGYALVESPFLGMEHQSAIAYGNKYQRGYLGGLIPDEFQFDYIIIHESGHEYFGNSVSVNDHADMWIHEGFTTYLESLYVEYLFGKKAAVRYLESQRKLIKNNAPMLGPKEVNYTRFPDSDLYYKGSWVLQTLRSAIKNDSVWFKLFRGFYEKYQYKNINASDFESYVNQFTGKDFTPFFNTYLRSTEIPELMVRIDTTENKTRIFYKINCTEQKLELPIEINMDGKIIQLDAITTERNIQFNRKFKSVKPVSTQSLIKIPQA